MNILEQFKLNGKTALVTGCNKGIGKAMALGLAEAGADIIGVSANLALSGSEVEKEVNTLGKNFKAYQCNFEDRTSLKNFTEKVVAENKQIDILVNNAGTIMRNPAAEHSDEFWDKVIAILRCTIYNYKRNRKKNDYTGKWQNYFYCIIVKFSGWCKCAGLCSKQRRYCQFNKSICK